jgi:hypothetical protein
VRQENACNLSLVAHFLTVARLGVETVRNDALCETAAETTVRRASLKDLAKQVLDRQPISGKADVRRAIAKAIEAACLTNYCAALLLGRLHLCGNCTSFQFAADPGELGQCKRFLTDTWPFVPFWCSGFQISSTPAAPAYLPDPDGARSGAKEYSK